MRPSPLRALPRAAVATRDRKSTRLNSSHSQISYAVFCLKKKKGLRVPHCAPRPGKLGVSLPAAAECFLLSVVLTSLWAGRSRLVDNLFCILDRVLLGSRR